MANNIKTIIVLGMHRTGTSMVAGVLARLGVNMGHELMPANRGNPSGYYEDIDFVRINREILGHKNNYILPVPPVEEIIKKKPEFAGRIKDLVNKKTAGKIWGWKDPRTSLTIELFLPYLPNPYFIVCRRQPLAVAKSLKKRDGLDIEIGLKVNAEYNQRLNIFFQQKPDLKKIDIFYEEAVAAPRLTVAKIAGFIGLPAGKEKLNATAKFIFSGWQKRKVRWRYYLKALVKL